ncbi:MAG: NAD-dependent epimerase/dehydratase family protein [Bacteriovoracaceae bacterium]|nr:NAD-dependent epimerase/dehydratase family protein [Bacteriovoracaceae bacterium]
MDVKEVNSILIIGIAGGLAKLTTNLLKKRYPNASIMGIDSRAITDEHTSEGVTYVQLRYSRNNFEKVFREKKFDVVYLLSRMGHGHFRPKNKLDMAIRKNVMGITLMLDLCRKNYVKKVISLSTYHVYGAYPDNSVFLDEEAPLRASIEYPELRDVVDVDQKTVNWMWQNQYEAETVIFRPCSVIGNLINNTITTYLQAPMAPKVIDFNPIFQFVYETDMANCLVHAIEKLPFGIYNVAPPGVVSIHRAKELMGYSTIPFPSFFLETAINMANKGAWSVPKYLIDYMKFSCSLDNAAILTFLGKDFFQYSSVEAVKQLAKS